MDNLSYEEEDFLLEKARTELFLSTFKSEKVENGKF